MLIARGRAVSFLCSDGRTIRPKGELLQDESGRVIPKDVVVIVPIRRTGKKLDDPPAEVRRHFGSAAPLEGRVRLPPLRSGWRKLCEVSEAYYTRRGEHAGQYEHAFGDRGLFRRGGELPVLYVHTSGAMKLELARGSWWDWAGAHN